MSHSDRVCVLQVDVCIHVSTCMYCLYAHTWTYACTMYIYILYMQVLNGCLAVTEFASWRLTSVHMYLPVQFVYTHMDVQCTYTFFTCRCSMSVSQCRVVSCRLTSVYMYLPVTHTWTYNVHIHSLHAGVQ